MTDTAKRWWKTNGMVILSGVFMVGLNYGVMTMTVAQKIDAEASRAIAEKEIKIEVIPVIEEHSKMLNQIITKDFSDTKLQLEMKFNLKRLMESQGIHYIENTDK